MSDNLKIMLTINTNVKRVCLKIDYNNKTALFNNKTINIDTDYFSSKILQIVSSWDNKMINPKIVDGMKYSVAIQKDGKKYNYIGENKFPNNFNELLKLLKEANIW